MAMTLSYKLNKLEAPLQRGDIILSYEDTIFSKLVRWVTNSKWSHVSIYAGTLWHINNKIWRIPNNETFCAMELGDDVKIVKNCVIGAVPNKGVSFTRLHEIKNRAIYRVENLSGDDIKKVIYSALSRLGHPYDYFQCLLLFYRIIANALTTYSGDPNPDKFICSELVAKAFLSIDVEFGSIIDNVLPETIASSPLTIRIK